MWLPCSLWVSSRLEVGVHLYAILLKIRLSYARGAIISGIPEEMMTVETREQIRLILKGVRGFSMPGSKPTSSSPRSLGGRIRILYIVDGRVRQVYNRNTAIEKRRRLSM
jgi:hypothetical protein